MNKLFQHRFIFILFCVLLANLPHINAQDFPLIFDFGNKNQKVENNSIAVPSGLKYTSKRGYGFISPIPESYQADSSFFYDYLTIDGVQSLKEIKFKVKLKQGNYNVLLYMAGGKKSIWKGEILINNKTIKNRLHRYEKNVEEESPPEIWVILSTVSITGNALTLEISADDLPATLSGLKIFRSLDYPVKLSKGKLSVNKDFIAPNSKLIIDLLNKGAVREAQKNIDAIPENIYAYQKAYLLLALAGRIETEYPRPYMEWAKVLFEKSKDMDKYPDVDFNIELINSFLTADTYYKMAGWDWAKKYTDESIFPRMDMAARLFENGAGLEGNPLQDRFRWELGKVAFWAWVEEQSEFTINVAKKQFRYLLQYYPDHALLKMYAGINVYFPPTPEELSNSDNIPDWAIYQVLALEKVRDLIHYWVNYRQADNGEFGGKFDDDVEMLRWWWVSRLVSDDQTALLGLQRLVNGIWNSGWITHGFSKKLRDVEHSSEPVADTQPIMIGLDFGNPIYVERCMESIKGIFKLWTGVNDYGHRHFKSSWYSSTTIDTSPPKDCDVEMNARTVKALRWLAWYNHHPMAMQFMKEWGNAWLEDCQRTDKGKPYGISPSAIRYEDDAIGGHADNWHHPGLFWNYFNYTGGIKTMNQLLTTYILTGEEKYLEPITEALKISIKYLQNEIENANTGTEPWVAGILRNSKGFSRILELWRNFTQDYSYDSVLVKNGSNYLKFLVTGDTSLLVDGCKQTIKGICKNEDLLTYEGYYTDRIEIGDLHKSEVLGVSNLESMYLGAPINEGFFPYYAVSWSGMGNNFAALVLNSSPEQAEILSYNLTETDVTGNIHFWNLESGTYLLKSKILSAQKNKEMHEFPADTIFVTNHFGSSRITLPAKEGVTISLKQIIKSTGTYTSLPDLAFAKEELVIEKSGKNNSINISILLHNIGIVNASEIKVSLRKEGKIIQSKTIEQLKAPLNLNPCNTPVNFQLDMPERKKINYTIIIDPEGEIKEITKINNQVSFQLNND